jgi:hypothetical protein
MFPARVTALESVLPLDPFPLVLSHSTYPLLHLVSMFSVVILQSYPVHCTDFLPVHCTDFLPVHCTDFLPVHCTDFLIFAFIVSTPFVEFRFHNFLLVPPSGPLFSIPLILGDFHLGSWVGIYPPPPPPPPPPPQVTDFLPSHLIFFLICAFIVSTPFLRSPRSSYPVPASPAYLVSSLLPYYCL